eukprot:comp21506_c0_seq1/m.29835 comp21506_c0_seq1/g.29835  ORF comp21506_c0_seq1/g.29835 comp21506_c0_seq1/m.29835 type:complete len:172 (-) comp21506_c0_seq1:242-757(-)
MATAKPPPTLSENLMRMKFMRRQQESDLRKALANETKRIIDENCWVLPGHEEGGALAPTVEVIESYVPLDDLRVCGRRSFLNFNPEIEKIWKEENDRQRLEEAEEFEKKNTITVEEMAQRYQDGIKKETKQKLKEEHTPMEEDGEQKGVKRKAGKRFYSEKNAKKFLRPSE